MVVKKGKDEGVVLAELAKVWRCEWAVDWPRAAADEGFRQSMERALRAVERARRACALFVGGCFLGVAVIGALRGILAALGLGEGFSKPPLPGAGAVIFAVIGLVAIVDARGKTRNSLGMDKRRRGARWFGLAGTCGAVLGAGWAALDAPGAPGRLFEVFAALGLGVWASRLGEAPMRALARQASRDIATAGEAWLAECCRLGAPQDHQEAIGLTLSLDETEFAVVTKGALGMEQASASALGSKGRGLAGKALDRWARVAVKRGWGAKMGKDRLGLEEQGRLGWLAAPWAMAVERDRLALESVAGGGADGSRGAPKNQARL